MPWLVTVYYLLLPPSPEVGVLALGCFCFLFFVAVRWYRGPLGSFLSFLFFLIN